MVTKFKSVLFLTVALFLASCGGNKSNENNVTDNQDSLSSEQTSDDQSQYVQLMEKQAQTEGEGCPYKTAPNLTLQSVTYTPGSFKYSYRLHVKGLPIDDNFRAEQKAGVEKVMVATIAANQAWAEVVEAMVATSTTLTYHYETGDGDTWDSVFTPTELESLLKQGQQQ